MKNKFLALLIILFLAFTLAIILILALMLVACGSAPQKGIKPSPDWSRSLSLGKGVVGSSGMFVDDETGHVHVVWPYNLGEGSNIRYVQLSQNANPLVTIDFSFRGNLRSPRIVSGGKDRLHLFWASRQTGEPGWSLWHAILGAGGDLIGDAAPIPIADMDVGGYAVADDGAGGVVVVWEARGSGEISLLYLDQNGEFLFYPIMITMDGTSPAIQVDHQGILHLSWLGDTGFMYTQVPLDEFDIGEIHNVAKVVIGTGDSLPGTALGLSDGWLYIVWSVLSQSGLEAGTSRTQYVAFPVDEPQLIEPSPIWIHPEEEPPYGPYNGELALTQLVDPPQVAWATTDYILRPAAAASQESELAIALAANQMFRLNPELQIAVAVFEDGQYMGYSFASKSDQLSNFPVLSLDDSGNLYTVWREGSSGQNIYYSTTESTAMAAIDRLDSGDFANALLQGTLESLTSILLMPIVGFGWILPGFLFLIIWKLIQDQESVTEPLSWIFLIVALLIYQTIKFVTLPTMVTYVPFSAWLYIPAGLEFPLRIAVPILIIIISVLVANAVRKRRSNSTLVFYLSMTLTDAILTLAIYGVNFLGVY
jgi:hypothetical protein